MKAIKTVLLIFLFSVSVQSKGWMVTVNYNVAVPGQQMQPFIKNTSLLGFGLDARKLISPHISLGASFGHQVFYWKTSETASLENGFFGSTQYRFLNTLPLMLNSHYYFNLSNGIEPYLGLNCGGYYGWQRAEMGIVVKEDRKWRWGLAPEAGVLVPVGTMRMNIGTKLSYLGLPGESMLGDPRKQLFMSFYVGLSFFDFNWR
ncbi:hypothetical protein EH223_19155 [candidate division KSB1 bacterium]|nr:hypothetical protein [candidate division KSB1 bacterium]RQW00315.1 MAG: hypothetical protein EH223_19155 [candidate division KSB1 bacterium]